MISLETIEAEIIELEKKDTSYAVVERLAWLYIVRNNLKQESIAESAVVSARSSGSEFLQTVSGMNVDSVLSVLDEHLEAVRIVYPREYDSVINRLKLI